MAWQELKSLIDQKCEQSDLNITGNQVIGLASLVILLIAGSTIFYLRSKPTQIKQDYYLQKSEKPSLSKKDTKNNKILVIHVCGAVKNPGVLKLKDGDRIVDAINKSGGATEEANLDALNLAAKLNDGQKVYVPKQGEQVPEEAVASPDGSSTTSPLININTATVDQLDSLPGVGEVLAQRIIDYRKSKGNFSSVEQLRNVEGIGPKKFEQIKDKVTVD